jgi:hypothetical protein
MHFSKSLRRDTGQEYIEILYVNILWMTDLTNCTLPAMDKRDAFQAESFNLILSAIG